MTLLNITFLAENIVEGLIISSDNSGGKDFFAYLYNKCLLVPIAIRDCVALIAIFCN